MSGPENHTFNFLKSKSLISDPCPDRRLEDHRELGEDIYEYISPLWTMLKTIWIQGPV